MTKTQKIRLVWLIAHFRDPMTCNVFPTTLEMIDLFEARVSELEDERDRWMRLCEEKNEQIAHDDFSRPGGE